ncbi:unnamed protein product [Dibothriocephalus latus]|uniref:Secreted protein n=1 Tax=Dibothriocephalus latus TaxID=60516 RepID=A0A3P7P684_DIBLA|nr:unnamed protein product [Dibothriocephalus latus]
MLSCIPLLLLSITTSFACSTNSEPEQCPRSDGQVSYADAVQKLVRSIQRYKEAYDLFKVTCNAFEMSIFAAQAKPQCHTVQSSVRVREVWCTIQTAQIDILIQQIAKGGAFWTSFDYVADYYVVIIPRAVLNVKLEETFLASSTASAFLLKLTELRIQNITSTIDEIQLSSLGIQLNPWSSWALARTGVFLQRAIVQRGVQQCQWS